MGKKRKKRNKRNQQKVNKFSNNSGKNKLILFLSKYKNTTSECKYKSKYDGTENEIKGIQTPDAPTKYFINDLAENNKKLDSILCITSHEANNGNEESAFENYEKMLNGFCKEKNIDIPKLIKLNFDYNFVENRPIDECDRYRDLFKSIVDQVSENDTVYIDYTSGIRDTSLLIILMIRYLEYAGIKCGGMIYSYFNFEDKQKNKIIDIKSTYDLFGLLNGVNEFTSFGKSKTLSNYYKNIKKEKEEHNEINELIEIMDKFSKDMSLCMVEDIDKITKELNENIKKAEKKIKAEEIDDKTNNNENKLMNYMFFNLIKEIKKKFYLEEGEEITCINLIKWCLDNDLTQQALTLYVEKIPEYYFDMEFFTKDKTSLETTIRNLNIQIDNYTNIFYTGIYANIFWEYRNKNKKNVNILEYKNKNSQYTYNGKINSIIILSEAPNNMPEWSNIKINDLIVIMKDYLFFKIMRNQINHAKKSKLREEVINFLNEENYKSNIDAEYIKDKMYESIERISKIKIKK